MRHIVHIILDVSRHRKIKHKPLRNRSEPYRSSAHIIIISAGVDFDLIPADAQIKRTFNLYEVTFGSEISQEQVKEYAKRMDAISYITA